MGEMRPQELRVGLVGLGYWGPNLLRVLADMQGAEVRSICDRDQQRLEHFAHRHPNVRCVHLHRRPAPRPGAGCGRARDADSHALRSRPRRAWRPANTPSSRSLSPAPGEEARHSSTSRSANDRVLMCGQTFLHSPPVRATKRLIERRRDRRHLLHLLEPRESRAAPARCQRDLGSRPARLLDPLVLAGRVPRDDHHRRPRLGRPRSPGRCLRDAEVPVGRRSPTSSSAGSRPGSSGGRSWSGARRWSCTRTGARSPSGSSTTASSTRIRRRSANITSPTEPATSSRRSSTRSSRSRSRWTNSCGQCARGAPPGHLELGRRVVTLAEAAQDSLDRDGARIALAGVV